jgi:HSP20 family protein
MPNIIRRRGRESGLLGRLADPLRIGSLTDPLRSDALDMMREMLGWDPFQEMAPIGALPGRAFSPDVEFRETKDAFVFTADLPGVDEEDIDVSVTGNRIDISGKREEETREEDERYYAYERSYGSFCRSFTLPAGANADEVRADFKNGVLTVRLPKLAEARPKRIELHSAKQLEQGEKQPEQAEKQPAQGKRKAA